MDSDTFTKIIVGVAGTAVGSFFMLLKFLLSRGERKTGLMRGIANELRQEIDNFKEVESNLTDKVRDLLKDNQELLLENTKLKTDVELLRGAILRLRVNITRLEQYVAELEKEIGDELPTKPSLDQVDEIG